MLDGFFDPYPINQILEVRYYLLETFADPKHEPLQKALAESAEEGVRKPLQEALYGELKQRIKANLPAAGNDKGQGGGEPAKPAAEGSQSDKQNAEKKPEEAEQPKSEEAKTE